MLALALAAVVAGCGPRPGVNDFFVQSPTNNSDFVQRQIKVGINPTTVAIGPSCAGPNANVPNMATSDFYSNTVTYLTNDGSGNFTTAEITMPPNPFANAPTRVQFADLDGTSATNCSYDLVVMMTCFDCGFGGGIQVLLTKDNVNWTSTFLSLPNFPEQVSVIDMNGDTFPDLVVSVPSATQLEIFLNDGTGNFSPNPISVPIFLAITNTYYSPTHFVVMDYKGKPLDFDGDKCTDLAVLAPGWNAVWIMESTNGIACAPYNNGTFLTMQTPVFAGPFEIAAVDLNNDTYPELVITSTNPGNTPWVNILQNPGPISNPPTNPWQNIYPGAPIPVSPDPERMAIGQFAAGLPPGIAITHPGDQAVTYLAYQSYNPNTSPNPACLSPWCLAKYAFDSEFLPSTPFDVSAGHFTTSGNLDLAVSEGANRIEFIGHGDGAGNFAFTQIGFLNGIGSPVIGRLRPNAKYDDIVLVQPANSTVMLLLNVNYP